MKANTKESLLVTFQTMLLGMGMFFLGRIIRNNGYYVLIAPLESGHPVLYEGLLYFGHIIFLALVVLYLVLDKNDRACCRKGVRFQKKSILLILLGLLCGFAMNSVSILSAVLHGDMDMSWRSFDPAGLIFIFFCVALQSSTEEIEFRLWAQHRIAAKAPVGYAAVGTALGFTLVHMLNAGISLPALINIFLIGVLFSLSVYYFGSIWFCCAYHTAWNFTQNCVFGLPNSGNAAVITMAAPNYTNGSFFYDPEFGVEGTGFTILLNVLAIAVFLILIKCRKNRENET